MDKSADLKDLDLTCASRGVWLVKVGMLFIMGRTGDRAILRLSVLR